MRKNVASQYVSFQMIAVADGSDVTSGTPAVYYTIDGGTQATGGGTATHEGNGQWSYLVVQAETNGDHVAWTMVLATAVSQTVNTYPVSFDPTDAVRIGLTSLPNAAADAAGGLAISDAGGLDLDTQLAATNEVTAVRMGALTDWINGGRLDLLLDAIPTTAMRGTDSAALASVATEARLAELDAGNLPTDIAAIPTTAMRGTDSAALASVATEARLAELDAANLPTDIAAIPTTAMRGTDSAALASVATEARLAELDAGNLPTDIAAIPTTAMRGTDSAALASEVTSARMATLTDWIDGGRLDLLLDAIPTTAMRGTDSAATATSLAAVSTTIGSAGAGLTEAGGTGDHLTAMPWNAAWDAEVESEVNDAIDTAISELGVGAPTATPTIRTGMMLMYMSLRNKSVTQTSGTDALEVYNDAGTIIAKKLLTDDGSDYTAAEMVSG
jgi:hypothetical protein